MGFCHLRPTFLLLKKYKLLRATSIMENEGLNGSEHGGMRVFHFGSIAQGGSKASAKAAKAAVETVKGIGSTTQSAKSPAAPSCALPPVE